jgi:hypothetical protein
MRSKWWSRTLVALAHAVPSVVARGQAPAEAEAEVSAAPTWRFSKSDRPVKVVVLAGSIGAWPKQPYAWHIERMCENVEVKNLSQTGLGTWALRKRFRDQVLDNRRIDWSAEGHEHWLVFGGGLNSVGTPKSSNQQARRLFLMAHARGMKVVGLSLTPWGDEGDRRFRGLEGLGRHTDTRLVVDYLMKRLTPPEALGAYADKRPDGAEAPWSVDELPDVSIDLYDSPLRDAEAEPRDVEAMKALLAADSQWQRAHRGLDAEAREARLAEDAARAADLPRWYLRPELRSFDHIHPNAEGHALIASTMCPSLPESWGCACDDAGGAAPEAAAD